MRAAVPKMRFAGAESTYFEERGMKKIEAILNPFKLDAEKEGLARASPERVSPLMK